MFSLLASRTIISLGCLFGQYCPCPPGLFAAVSDHKYGWFRSAFWNRSLFPQGLASVETDPG